MKKIFISIAVLAISIAASAQQAKTVEAAAAAVKKAVATSENPKQNTKAPVWIKLGQAYMDAYTAPMGNGWIGASAQDLSLVMAGEQPTAVEAVNVGGEAFTKQSYANSDYYFNQAGWLQMIIITKPVYEDALDQALVAYTKAGELDVKGAKTKDITEGLLKVSQRFSEEAYNAYSFNDIAAASANFEKAAIAKGTAPLSQIDTNSIFNAGFTAWAIQDYDRAKKFLERSIEIGYYGEDGDAFVKLADVVKNQGDTVRCQEILENAFTQFPQSQGVLVGLINFYMNGSGNASRLFELLDAAKANEPNNASLYYVEGNIHAELKEIEAAVAAYEKCSEINPAYEYGFIGEGQMYYNLAIELQDKANAEEDYKKWQALDKEFAQTLKNCIAPFEKAFDLTASNEIKTVIAEYLKNASFRFRDEAPEYAEKYEKYNAFVQANKQ